MFSLEIFFLGLALAIDAAVASFALGLLSKGLSRKTKLERGLVLAFVFGLFQFLMLWLGSFGGYLFSFSSYGSLFHFVVAGIFLIMAMKLIQESFEKEERDIEWGIMHIATLAVATSIDALAAGVSLGTLPNAHRAAIEVGVITSFMCAVFYVLSQFLHHLPVKWLLRLASLVFIILGGQIIWDYVLRGVV